MASDNDDKIGQHLDAGYEALEKGNLGVARKAAQAALALDAATPDAHMLLAALAERDGDTAAERKAYADARKADPDAVAPILALADLEYAGGNAAAARKLFIEAVDRAEEEEEYVEAVLARAEFELAEGDGEAAKEILSELPQVDLPDTNDHLRAGDALRQVAALVLADAEALLAEAQQHFDAAYRQAGKQADVLADALYGMGLVAEARGQRAEMIARFEEVLVFDSKETRPPFSPNEAEMEKLVEEALAELPPRALELLSNVPIVVEPRPTRAQVGDGLDPRLLGLFSGPTRDEGGDSPVLRQITLYARNLERAAASREDLEEEVRVTLLHETGHFFGLEEDDLAEMGLD